MWTSHLRWLVLTPFIVAALAFTPSAYAGDDGLTAKQIVDKMLSRNQMGFDSGQATVRMTVKTSRGEVLERKLLTRGEEKNGHARVRITFLEPADQAGIEVLLLQSDGQDLQYLYLPRFKRHRRISGGAKNGRFEGSDFTYADLESRDVKGGRYERKPDEQFGKQDVYRVVAYPDPSDPDELYSKVDLWIDKHTSVALKSVFYDRQGRKLKVLKVKRIKKLAGRYIATRMLMSDVQHGSETVLVIEGVTTDVTFPTSLFAVESLGK